jgi:hypothetical protein
LDDAPIVEETMEDAIDELPDLGAPAVEEEMPSLEMTDEPDADEQVSE